MTRPQPFDQLLGDWLAEGPEIAPRELLEAVLVTIPIRRQRRRLWTAGRRFRTLSLPVRLATAVTVFVVLGVVGLSVARFGGNPSIGGATPTPAPTPSVSPAAASSVPTPSPSSTSRISGTVQIADGAVLKAGTKYTLTSFTPAFTFVGQDGWTLKGSDPSSAAFWVGGDIGQGLFMVERPAQVLEVGGAVAPVPSDLVAWLQARSDLILAKPTKVTVGGFTGQLLDGTVRSGAQVNGANALNIACFAGPECSPDSSFGLGFAADNHFQLVVVRVRGQTLLIDMTANSAAWNTVHPRLAAFLAGFAFPLPAGG
jgi:hypothetical protein